MLVLTAPAISWMGCASSQTRRRPPIDGPLDQFLPGKYDPPAFTPKLAYKNV
jgi:hypothetical protein